jgi:hypothetical protein
MRSVFSIPFTNLRFPFILGCDPNIALTTGFHQRVANLILCQPTRLRIFFLANQTRLRPCSTAAIGRNPAPQAAGGITS